jgi:hypothetical protein
MIYFLFQIFMSLYVQLKWLRGGEVPFNSLIFAAALWSTDSKKLSIRFSQKAMVVLPHSNKIYTVFVGLFHFMLAVLFVCVVREIEQPLSSVRNKFVPKKDNEICNRRTHLP